MKSKQIYLIVCCIEYFISYRNYLNSGTNAFEIKLYCDLSVSHWDYSKMKWYVCCNFGRLHLIIYYFHRPWNHSILLIQPFYGYWVESGPVGIGLPHFYRTENPFQFIHSTRSTPTVNHPFCGFKSPLHKYLLFSSLRWAPCSFFS